MLPIQSATGLTPAPQGRTLSAERAHTRPVQADSEAAQTRFRKLQAPRIEAHAAFTYSANATPVQEKLAQRIDTYA